MINNFSITSNTGGIFAFNQAFNGSSNNVTGGAVSMVNVFSIANNDAGFIGVFNNVYNGASSGTAARSAATTRSMRSTTRRSMSSCIELVSASATARAAFVTRPAAAASPLRYVVAQVGRSVSSR